MACRQEVLVIISYCLSKSRLYPVGIGSQDSPLLTLVDVLEGVAQGDSTPPINRQTALFSIKLLARRIASRHRDVFIKVCWISCHLMCRYAGI